MFKFNISLKLKKNIFGILSAILVPIAILLMAYPFQGKIIPLCRFVSAILFPFCVFKMNLYSKLLKAEVTEKNDRINKLLDLAFTFLTIVGGLWSLLYYYL